MRTLTDDTLSGYPVLPDPANPHECFLTRLFGCWRRHEHHTYLFCDEPVADPGLGLCADHLHEMRNAHHA